MLKQLIAIITLLMLQVVATEAQNLKTVKEDIYYERFETAKAMLEQMISSGNADPETYYLLGEIYMEQKNDSAAAEVLKKGLDYVAANGLSMKKAALLYIGKAHLLLNENKTAEARQLTDEVLAAGKFKDADALYAAGRANVDSKYGDMNYAFELLEKAINRNKKNPFIYTAIADAYRKAIDGSNAVRYYDQALAVKPTFAEAMYKKGKLYKTHNNPQVYLEKFNSAVAMDSNYAPALYELYNYYSKVDVVLAKKYLDAYARHAEPSVETDYMRTDLLYLSQQYKEAIEGAKNILAAEKDKAQPRLYKLIAYSEALSGDSASALQYMNTYFEKQNDTLFVAKDYDLKAKLLQATRADKATVADLYKQALLLETDKEEKVNYLYALAELEKELGNPEQEARWREQIYTTKEKPSNLDLYKWGIALYSDKDYAKADSVFGIYEENYPDQVYGPLWRAKCNALIDTAMTMGLAVPYYQKLAAVASKDEEKNKGLIIQAYNYLGIYEANITKDYPVSLDYFEKILEIDPANADAEKFSGILKTWIEKNTTGHPGNDSENEKNTSAQNKNRPAN